MPDAILEHPFFQRVQRQGFSLALLWSFIQQYEILSREFPRFLGLAIASADDELASAAIVRNLWDEYGRGNPAAGHRPLLARFITAAVKAGLYRDSDSPSPLPETEIYLRGLSSLATAGETPLCLGALWFIEAVTPGEYSIIVSGLRKLHPFSDQELGFFLDHINHDNIHLSDLEGSLSTALGAKNRSDRFEAGIVQARVLESLFWDGVLRGESSS